jgi:hypothetical protein
VKKNHIKCWQGGREEAVLYGLWWETGSGRGYYWGYVIECDFAVEGHIILKILLLLRIFFKSS